MTAISANPMPPTVEPLSSATGSPAGTASGSFADTLLAVLDRAIADTPGALADRFASGTMRSSVERFNERGFFEDRLASDPRDSGPSLASGSGAVPGVPQPTSPPVLHPLLQSDPLAPPPVRLPPASPPVALPIGVLASDPGTGEPLTAAGSHASGSRPPVLANSQTGTIVPLASMPGGRLAGAIIDAPALPEGPARAALHRDPAALAASRVKVSLDHREAGVAVSVVADIDSDADAGAIHEAVSHLLARHGLVLSDLRVTRRPGAGSQDRKD